MPRGRFSARYSLPPAPPARPQQQSAPVFNPLQAQYQQNQILHQQAQLSKDQADIAESNRKLANGIERDRQRQAYYDGAHQLEQELAAHQIHKGSQQYADAFSEFASGFPDARASQDVREDMKYHSLVHDDQAALTQRLQTSIDAGKALGLTPQGASFVKGGNVDVRFTQPTAADTEGSDPEAELFKSRGLTKAQFLNPLNAKQGVINDKNDFVTNFAPGQVANAIQFQAGSSKTDEAKTVTHVMPLQEFNAYRQGLGQQPLPAFQYPGATPAPTVAPTAAPVQPSATPDQTPIYTPSPSPEATSTPDHSAAISWAQSNPNDPRAQVILSRAQAAIPQTTPQDEGQ